MFVMKRGGKGKFIDWLNPVTIKYAKECIDKASTYDDLCRMWDKKISFVKYRVARDFPAENCKFVRTPAISTARLGRMVRECGTIEELVTEFGVCKHRVMARVNSDFPQFSEKFNSGRRSSVLKRADKVLALVGKMSYDAIGEALDLSVSQVKYTIKLSKGK